MTFRSKDFIIELAIQELKRNRERIGDLLPCSITIHMPPQEGKDLPCIEVKARLRPKG